MFEPEYFFSLFLEISQILYIRIIQIQIGKNYWEKLENVFGIYENTVWPQKFEKISQHLLNLLSNAQ